MTSWTTMKVKVRYAAGVTGSVLHKIDQGSKRNKIQWLTWPDGNKHHGRQRAELIVKLQCQRPSILRNPILMDEINIYPAPEFRKMMGYPRRLTLCKWCFTTEERSQ